MTSKWSETDLHEAKLLSDVDACAFLKSLYHQEYGPEKSNERSFREKLENEFFSRNSERINFYICRYGITAENVISSLQNEKPKEDPVPYYSDTNYLAALNNKIYVGNMYWDQESLVRRLINDFPKTRECLSAIFSNPAFERNTITDILEKRSEIEKFQEPEFLNYFSNLIADCPAVHKEYDNIHLDGWAEYSHSNLNFQFFNLLCDMQPSDEVADAANQFSRVAQPLDSSKVEIYTQVIEKWRDPKFHEKPSFKNNYNSKFYSVRNSLARMYFNSNIFKQRSFYETHKIDPAVRHAFYRGGTIDALLSVRRHEVDTPDFRAYSDTKSKNVSEGVRDRLATLQNKSPSDLSSLEMIEQRILEYFCDDENEFIAHVAYNAHFWHAERANSLIERLGWDLALDPMSTMDTINTIRYSRRHFENLDQSLATKTVSIEDKIDALEQRLSTLIEGMPKAEDRVEDDKIHELNSLKNSLSDFKEATMEDAEQRFSKLLKEIVDLEKLMLDRLQLLENEVANGWPKIKKLVVWMFIICGAILYLVNN